MTVVAVWSGPITVVGRCVGHGVLAIIVTVLPKPVSAVRQQWQVVHNTSWTAITIETRPSEYQTDRKVDLVGIGAVAEYTGFEAGGDMQQSFQRTRHLGLQGEEVRGHRCTASRFVRR